MDGFQGKTLIIENIIIPICKALWNFAKWLYGTLLPFILQYFAIPLFCLGIVLGLGFAGGTIVFTIVFFIFMIYFIKGTILSS